MSAQKIRCSKCRGQKQYAGIGGVMKDCGVCNATGLVDYVELKVVKVEVVINDATPNSPVVEPIVEAAPKKKKAKKKVAAEGDKCPETADMATVSAEFVPPQPAPVAQKQESGVKEPIFPGYPDELMEAVLAEPTMNSEDWRKAYPAIADSSDVRTRHGIRVMYAQSRVSAPRKVNLGAAQDSAIKGDPEVAAFEAKEKARLEAESKKATDAPLSASVKKGSKVGGM